MEETIEFKLASKGIRNDEVVRHNLGRVPTRVILENYRPKDGFTAFWCGEPDPSKRTAKTITLRTDSFTPGDIVVFTVR